MSDNIQHIDLDDDDFQDAPKALREYARRLKSRLTEVEKERDSFKGQATAAALGDVLQGFKNPERVKRDLVSDKVDPLDPKAVEEWLSENGADYARAEGAPSSAPPVHEDAAAQEQLNAGSEQRTPADMSKLEAALAELPPNATGADVEAVYRKHGV